MVPSAYNPGEWFNQGGAKAFHQVAKDNGLFSKNHNFEPIARRMLIMGHLPNAMSNAQFAQEMSPVRQSAIRHTATLMNPMNRQKSVDQFRRRINSEARTNLEEMLPWLQEEGASPMQIASAMLNANNQATQMGNEYDAEINSPAGMMRAYQDMLSMIDGGLANDPSTSLVANLSASTPFKKTQSKGGLGGFLGSIAGTAANAFINQQGIFAK